MITKHKSRYILVEASEPIDTQDKTSSQDLLNSLQKQIGEIGHTETNPKLAFQYSPNVFIIKVNRGSEKQVIRALAFVKEIRGKKIGLYTIKTSGTIRTLIEYCKNTY